MLKQGGFRTQPWVKWRVKDGQKGPMVWEIKHLRSSPVSEDGLPGPPLHLMVARDVLNPAELKFFVSNAPAGASVQGRLLAAFSRWRVERCFEDQKSEIGMDQYEGRRYRGLKRHLILSCVSYLFLSRARREFGGEKSGVDGVPGPHGDRRVDPVLVAEPAAAEEVAEAEVRGDRADAEEKCVVAEKSHQGDEKEIAGVRHQAHRSSPLFLGEDLAL
jgi:hypothetical protein